jgi:hypothetical protein
VLCNDGLEPPALEQGNMREENGDGMLGEGCEEEVQRALMAI